MFAGKAEATRMMRYAGHCAAKLDYKYHVASPGKQNYMDILTPAGFLLAVSTVLRGDPRGFWCHFGIKCGSWSQVSQGTSGRSVFTALGNEDQTFVREGNCMAARMSLLLLLVTALKGAWSVEQPSGSFLEYFPNYPPQFGLRLVELHDQVLATQRGTPELPKDLPTAVDTFSMMSFDDLWEDANMVECIRYIRGGTSLRIPENFRPLLPTRL
ncbi:unnamed protein product [Symbiodinium necroappetens]|uniref:Uncharacterized protein n=1 Tax=Symbiodinium necroappetens TaxID=1628268 RepID=A0A812LVL5_9DINO|nr:unnamed protein product [Symbiodinium necroappetens]